MSEGLPPPEAAAAGAIAPPGRATPAGALGALRAGARRVAQVLSSFALAIVLLLVLLVLTFLGTLEQRHASLFEVQRKYFESVVLVHDFGPYSVWTPWAPDGMEVGPISIPLPGASVVLALLALNLIVGGVVRLRKRVATLGVLVAHLGILLLLAGSFVEFLVSEKGQLTLYEPEPGRPPTAEESAGSNEFRAWNEWEIVVRERHEGTRTTEFVLDAERLRDLDPDDVVRFSHARLPFVVEVTDWRRNATPVRASGEADALEGWRLEGSPPRKEAERNRPGSRVTFARSGAALARGLVWSAQALPWVATVDARRFEVALRTRRWTFPFRLVLRRFVHDEHPGTSMAREFSSYVTKVEDGVRRDVHVTMNEPFRHRGYTFYQSSWGPQDAAPGEPLWSTFSVVRNPADRVPLIACLVIAAGLLLQFGRKLVLHVGAQARGRSGTGGPA